MSKRPERRFSQCDSSPAMSLLRFALTFGAAFFFTTLFLTAFFLTTFFFYEHSRAGSNSGGERATNATTHAARIAAMPITARCWLLVLPIISSPWVLPSS